MNTKLYCPSCGWFLLMVERIVALRTRSYECGIDVEFARSPARPGLIDATGIAVPECIIVRLPEGIVARRTKGGKPGPFCPMCGMSITPNADGAANCNRCAHQIRVVYQNLPPEFTASGRELCSRAVVWFPDCIGGK